MKYCPSCGSETKQEAAFCPSCGTSMSSEASGKKSVKEKWKELPKAFQLSILSAAAIIIIFVVFIQLGNTLSSPERAVSGFEKALEEKDAEQLADMVIAEDERMEVKTEDIEAILTYLEERPSVSREIISSLEADAAFFQNENKEEASASEEEWWDEEDGALFSLWKEEGILFDKYEIQMPSYYIELSSNMEGAELLMDGESAGVVKEEGGKKEYGPIPPGNYEVSAVYEGEYADLETTEELSTINEPERTLTQKLELEGEQTTVIPEDIWREADSVTPVLKINGEAIETDGSLEKEIYPVSLDGSQTASMEAEFPWGKIESAPVPIQERRTEIELEPIEPDTKQELAAQAYNVLPAFEEAVEKENMESLEYLSEAAISDMKEAFNESITVKEMELDSFSYDEAFDFIENDEGEAALAGNFEMKYQRTYERHENEYDSSEIDYYTLYYVYDEESDSWEIDEFTKGNSFFNRMENPIEYKEEVEA
ncbi:TcaA 3rd/4th domain-containing protein [Salibacterium aidingense]|uniref:TcaA 3rd/4th domain-containing protein n=1 Tax=Salibacterium aidingense TaxID=384933 RepID=UPI003BBD8A07